MTGPAERSTLLVWGFMGAGKSTVARLVAARVQARFVDLDALVEERTGASIATIFRDRGEPEFRRIERALLAELLDEPVTERRVIALGGGTLLDDALRERALCEAFVVTLAIDAATVVARTAASERPLIQGPDPESIVRNLLAARQGAYTEAHATLEADSDPATISKKICDLWCARRPSDPSSP
jgi:shikimate kinase / 3-dehydroquinate synthase